MVDTEQLKAFKIFKDLNERELELIANYAQDTRALEHAIKLLEQRSKIANVRNHER
jgi:hypothetical protein